VHGGSVQEARTSGSSTRPPARRCWTTRRRPRPPARVPPSTLPCLAAARVRLVRQHPRFLCIRRRSRPSPAPDRFRLLWTAPTGARAWWGYLLDAPWCARREVGEGAESTGYQSKKRGRWAPRPALRRTTAGRAHRRPRRRGVPFLGPAAAQASCS